MIIMNNNQDQLRQLLNDFLSSDEYSLDQLSKVTGRGIRLLESFITGNYILSEDICGQIINSLISDNESAIILLRKLDEEFVDLPLLNRNNI